MSVALVFNPGSNSLKFELIELDHTQKLASGHCMLAIAVLDGIGQETKLLIYHRREVMSTQPWDASDMTAAATQALRWLTTETQ